MSEDTQIEQIINQALDEDLGKLGDITSNFTIPKDKEIHFQISNREELVLCGVKFVSQIFTKVAQRLNLPEVILKINHQDGEVLPENTAIISGNGNARVVFAAERLVLNLMQHLSGVATITHQYVSKIRTSKTKILDTRKTLPAFRILQKYAVKIGGGTNHRMALFDGILIKDNHIAAAGNIKNAVQMVRQNLAKENLKLPIEVECDDLNQVQEALESRVDIIMLDNMNLEQISAALKIIKSQAKVEVSGGVGLDDVAAIAKTGVDFISIGALTHSVRSVDIGLDVIS